MSGYPAVAAQVAASPSPAPRRWYMRKILFSAASFVSMGTVLFACSSSGGGGGTPTPDAATSDEAGPIGTNDAGAADAAVAPVEWDRKVSGAPIDGVATTAAGEVFIAGGLPFTTNFSTDFGGGKVTPKANETTFLAKYDAKGGLAWVKLFTGAEKMTQAWSLASDGADGVYLAGVASAPVNLGGTEIPLGFTGTKAMEAVIAHYDGSGKHLSSKAVLDCLDECSAPMLAANAKGLAFNIVAAGDVQTPFVMVGGTQDYYKGGGNLQYTESAGAGGRVGTIGGAAPFGVAQDADGNVYSGLSQQSFAEVTEIDTTGAQKADYNLTDLPQSYAFATNGVNLFLSGISSQAPLSIHHQFFQTVGSTILWTVDVTFPNDSEVRPNSGTVIYDPASKTSVFALEFLKSISVAGVTFTTTQAGDYDIAVVRFDHKGKLVGHKQIGQTSHAEAVKALGVLPGGRVVVAGDGDGVSLFHAFTL